MKNWTYVLLLVLTACGQKRQSPTDAAATRVCDCFRHKTVGTVEDKLTPCYQRALAEKQKELLGSTFSNTDSIQGKLAAFGLDLMIGLTRNCNAYFSEIDKLYDNSYPLDSSVENKEAIRQLTNKIEVEANKDSIKELLNARFHKLIQSRRYTLALNDIRRIEAIDSSDHRVHMAKAFLFAQTGMYDDAIAEVEKSIAFSGNPNMILYAEIIRRKREADNQ
jgi:hypothetical protein